MTDLSILGKVAKDPEELIAFSGELMLYKYRAGQRWQVTFDIAMDGDSHPFNQYSGRATGRQGTRFMAVLVELDDQDNPVNVNHKLIARQTSNERMSGAAMVRESGILRNDLWFQRFLWVKFKTMDEIYKQGIADNLPHGFYTELVESDGLALSDKKKAKRFADYMVHFLCGVESCRELAYKGPESDMFNELRNEYMRWMAVKMKKVNN